MTALPLIVDLAFDRAYEAITGESRDALAFDRTHSLRTIDADGRMHVERCNISKANVCPYYGREIPNHAALGLDPNRVYRMYRDPAELAAGARTFDRAPLLMVHTKHSADDAKQYVTVGTIGSDVTFDGTYLTASLAVWTAEGIKLVESKKQAQLSCSYRYRPDMTPGKTPQGVAYDGVMRDIIGNHVALVEQGRAGPDVYVSDSQPSELRHMKRALLIAAVAQALGVTAATDEQRLAADTAIDAAMCKETDDEKKVREAKEAQDALLKAAQPRGGANDVQLAVDAAIAAGGYVTKTEADKLASDASNAAVARVNALNKAREDVRPLVGVVALDSADAVYEFALKHCKVAHDGVSPTAYPVLVEQVKLARAAKAGATEPVRLASDSASVAAAIPGLGRYGA